MQLIDAIADVTEPLRFQVQIFNVSLFCENEFVMEPGSLKFLNEHGYVGRHCNDAVVTKLSREW